MCAVGAIVIIFIVDAWRGNLNIKSRTVGDGQYGSARWASQQEINETYHVIPFEPKKWRTGKSLPQLEGATVLGYLGRPGHVSTRIDISGNHTMLISTTGGGKTTFFLYPNFEMTCACGFSFLATDTKGDVFRDYAGIAQKYYGYTPYVIDLRNPTRSHGFNLLHLVNKYIDLYKKRGSLSDKARAERYAKITAKTIVRVHEKEELSFYSKATTDIEFLFPFGWGELWGIADRTDYDLTQHQNHSGKSLEYFDQEANERYIPYVVEPSLGADRVALAFLCDAYDEEKLDEKDTRVVLRLHPALAPYKAAVLPLSKKLNGKAQEVYTLLAKHFMADFDDAGSIGKRYRRQDEIGTPFCVTYDFESENDGCVTVRDRDTMLRRIFIKAFPPNCVVIQVLYNVGENSAGHCRSKCVRVGLFVRTRCNAEEAVFRVNCIQSAIRALTHPSDIVADSPDFVALFNVAFRWNQHCEVSLSASGRECSCNIFNVALRILDP